VELGADSFNYIYSSADFVITIGNNPKKSLRVIIYNTDYDITDQSPKDKVWDRHGSGYDLSFFKE